MLALIVDNREKRYWREYVATHLWATAGAIYATSGKELPTPSYTEVLHPKPKETAESIKKSILLKLQK